ncbi:MAG: ornithine cyclodeaminase family protein [Acidobacteria bacterium]|nr:ornithine cyclodeaminase family protein [Acidobacteriota bacterium]
MKLLVLSHAEVERLLPMRECVEVMARALVSFSRGEVAQPLRTVLRPEGAAGLLGLMPAYKAGGSVGGAAAGGEGAGDGGAAFGLKAICVFPGNAARGVDAHQGCVALFDGGTGEPRAVVNASAITAIRTAAVSAVATRALAREGAHDLAVVGAGVQARAHLAALSCVREIKRARVASRTAEKARGLVEETESRYGFPVEACETVEEAVRGADLIVTATSAREPVLRREWIAKGAHLNAVGTFSPRSREVDSETVAQSSLFVDSRESALNEAGDILIPMREGLITAEHIRAEVGEVLTGARAGRTSLEEITLFKSLGLAVEDLAAAQFVFSRARETNAGAWVEF